MKDACTTRCVLNASSRTWKRTCTEPSKFANRVPMAGKQDYNNKITAASGDRTSRPRHQRRITASFKNKTWQAVHRGNTGPFLKAYEDHTERENNCNNGGYNHPGALGRPHLRTEKSRNGQQPAGNVQACVQLYVRNLALKR